MPRRAESIYKNNGDIRKNRYVKSFSPDGINKYTLISANSYNEAKRKQHLLLNLQKNNYNSLNRKLSFLVNEWLNSIYNNVKINTYRKYEIICKKYIIAEMGNTLIKTINQSIIRNFTDKLINFKLSNQTINDILLVLNLVLKYAEIEYHLLPVRITYLKVEKKEMRVLSKEEQTTLTNYLTENMDIFKFGVLLALYTGIRVGELCALTWSDVTDEAIIINKTMYRTKGEDTKTIVKTGTPKTESSKRKIPTPKSLIKYINRYRTNGYLLSTEMLSFCEPRLMQIKFSKMICECNIEKTNFHALRHTFATRCVEAGVDIKTLSEILGHSDVKTTLNKYVHSSFELKQISIDKFEKSL